MRETHLLIIFHLWNHQTHLGLSHEAALPNNSEWLAIISPINVMGKIINLQFGKVYTIRVWWYYIDIGDGLCHWAYQQVMFFHMEPTNFWSSTSHPSPGHLPHIARQNNSPLTLGTRPEMPESGATRSAWHRQVWCSKRSRFSRF